MQIAMWVSLSWSTGAFLAAKIFFAFLRLSDCSFYQFETSENFWKELPQVRFTIPVETSWNSHSFPITSVAGKQNEELVLVSSLFYRVILFVYSSKIHNILVVVLILLPEINLETSKFLRLWREKYFIHAVHRDFCNSSYHFHHKCGFLVGFTNFYSSAVWAFWTIFQVPSL